MGAKVVRHSYTLPQTPTPRRKGRASSRVLDNLPAHTVKVWTAAARFAR